MERSARRKRAALRIAAGSLFLLLVATILVVRCKYGSGEPYPDLGTEPVVAGTVVEILVEPPFPPGNVTSSPDGRIFYNLHPFARPERFIDRFVFELVDGESRPYPDLAQQERLRGVLGMTVDRQNRLWMVRPAGIEEQPTRLFAFDLTTDQLVVDVAFDDGVGPFAQDLRAAPDGATIYLADTGIFRFTSAALIVFDVGTKQARRVLEGHPSVTPQDWVIRTAGNDYKLVYGLLTFAVGVDGVAVSHDGEWLYYATMTHDTVYRIRTSDLRDPTLDDEALGRRVERVGSKPLSDGIEIDRSGDLYITDVEHGGISRLTPDGHLETFVRRDDIVWADGVNISAQGDLLFTDSAIPAYIDPLLRAPAPRKVEQAPHRIYRVPR